MVQFSGQSFAKIFISKEKEYNQLISFLSKQIRGDKILKSDCSLAQNKACFVLCGPLFLICRSYEVDISQYSFCILEKCVWRYVVGFILHF